MSVMVNSARACVIIPARYASSRFPGKPLVKILGKPMILWVAELSACAVGKPNVYIATDDKRIADVASNEGFSSLMTNPDALTGTDRLAEAATKIDYDIYVNVQGDEPLAYPEDIRRCIALKHEYVDKIVNGFCWVGVEEVPESANIPKVITTETGLMVYMSRALVPGVKDPKIAPSRYMKQVCIYGFNRDDLMVFADFGRKSRLEQYEDIEILRFLELRRDVLMFECHPGSLSVDVPSDVRKVEIALRQRTRSCL